MIQSHFVIRLQNTVHCKKRLAIFPSIAGMSLTKLSPAWAGNNLIIPGQGDLVIDIPVGTEKSLTFFLQCIFPEHYKIFSKVVLPRHYNTNTLNPFEMLQIYDVSAPKTARLSLQALRGERGR
jgi:hypothetical protein